MDSGQTRHCLLDVGHVQAFHRIIALTSALDDGRAQHAFVPIGPYLASVVEVLVLVLAITECQPNAALAAVQEVIPV